MPTNTPISSDKVIHAISEAAGRTDYSDTVTTDLLLLSILHFQTRRDLKSPAANELRRKVHASLVKRGEYTMAHALYPEIAKTESDTQIEPFMELNDTAHVSWFRRFWRRSESHA